MSKNKLYTKSYFKKRLIEGGFFIDNEKEINYNENDIRKWSIIINPNIVNCTCFKTQNDYWFLFLFKNSTNTVKLKTSSMDTVIKFIKDNYNYNEK